MWLLEKSYTLIEINTNKGTCFFHSREKSEASADQVLFFDKAKRRYQDFKTSLFLPSVENDAQQPIIT